MASSKEAAKAIDSLRLAEVRGKIQQQLEACGNDPVAAFHYRFLSGRGLMLGHHPRL